MRRAFFSIEKVICITRLTDSGGHIKVDGSCSITTNGNLGLIHWTKIIDLSEKKEERRGGKDR